MSALSNSSNRTSFARGIKTEKRPVFKRPLSGSIVAIVTPMLDDGAIDYLSLESLLEWHISMGTDGVVIVGTTGESPAVSVDEHCELIRFTVKKVSGRMLVIAGTGANSTSEAIELTHFAKSVGTDASLQVVPYYNRPTQEGIFQHFAAIAHAVDIPIILYNVPGRTVVDMSNETIVRLAHIHNIIGVKEASGQIARGIELINTVPIGFSVLSGDDSTALALMLCGAVGNISVTANVMPRAMHLMCAAALRGDVTEARRLNLLMLDLNKNLFLEPNPIPVKWVLSKMNKIKPNLRLPLTPLSLAHHSLLEQSMTNVGVVL